MRERPRLTAMQACSRSRVSQMTRPLARARGILHRKRFDDALPLLLANGTPVELEDPVWDIHGEDASVSGRVR